MTATWVNAFHFCQYSQFDDSIILGDTCSLAYEHFWCNKHVISGLHNSIWRMYGFRFNFSGTLENQK